MIDGPAAGGAADNGYSVFPGIVLVDLCGRELVEAYDDGPLVLPEEQPVALPPVFKHIFLKGQVVCRVKAARFKIVGHIVLQSPQYRPAIAGPGPG